MSGASVRLDTTSRRQTEVTPIRLDRKKAASYLCLSVRSIDYLIKNKRLPARRDGGKIFVLVNDLDRYAHQDHSDNIRH